MSASTPEGAMKKRVSALLSSYPNLYKNMPVPGGYGASQLDYVCCYKGRFFAIETKAPDKWLTPLQRMTARNVHMAGGRVFIISTGDGLNALRKYLNVLRAIKPRELIWRNS